MIKLLIFLLFMIPIIGYYDLIYIIIIYIFIYLFININISLNIILLGYNIGLDIIRIILIILTLWLICLVILSSNKIYNKNYFTNLFNFILLIIIIILILTFRVLNILILYLFFEARIIPIIFIIIGWGYQPERIQAGIYLIFYTIIASIPILISIFIYKYIYLSISLYLINILNRKFILIIFIMIFLVKFPIYIFHLWLPKAHVEAPVSGSILLAGIILKLGGYGIIRFIIIFKNYLNLNLYFFIISLLGGVIISYICIRQTDIKSLIAYSSISHIGIVICGIFSLYYIGYIGSIYLIVAHGLRSSGLFLLSNIIYERSNRRSLYLNKGLINLCPNLRLYWFLILRSNIAAPPSLNLLREILLINTIVTYSLISVFLLLVVCFISVAYSLYLYSFRQHGKLNYRYSFYNINIREYLRLLMHWLPLNILILFLVIYLNSLNKILICGIKVIN